MKRVVLSKMHATPESRSARVLPNRGVGRMLKMAASGSNQLRHSRLKLLDPQALRDEAEAKQDECTTLAGGATFGGRGYSKYKKCLNQLNRTETWRIGNESLCDKLPPVCYGHGVSPPAAFQRTISPPETRFCRLQAADGTTLLWVTELHEEQMRVPSRLGWSSVRHRHHNRMFVLQYNVRCLGQRWLHCHLFPHQECHAWPSTVRLHPLDGFRNNGCGSERPSRVLQGGRAHKLPHDARDVML